MLRILGIVLALAGGVVYAAEAFHRPPLKCYLPNLVQGKNGPARYCEQDPMELDALAAALKREETALQQQVDLMEQRFSQQMMEMTRESRLRRETETIVEPAQLTAKRQELAYVSSERQMLENTQRLQRLPLAAIALATSGFGLFLFALSFVQFGGSRVPRDFRRSIEDLSEDKWVQPERAPMALDALQPRRRDAVEELWALRPQSCNYCQKALPRTPAGRIVHVHLLKEAPTDVKATKRIPLGDGYRAIPPESVTCPECSHANRVR